jgi:polysaccharide pyruvyl transferase WcaK-like protein
MLDRRTFLGMLASSAVAGACRPLVGGFGERTPQTVLVANCWHDINIGDIAHAPGLIGLIEKHLPEVEIILWPYPTPKGPGEQRGRRSRDLTPEVRSMLTTAFPRLTILKPGGEGQREGATRPDLVAAIERADLFILGSGGYHGSPVNIWRASTDKPFGIYGVTFAGRPREVLSEAAFVFCRDSLSVESLKEAGVRTPVLEFGPDSTFGLQLRDEERARKYLRDVGLKTGEFLCVVPRLRYSPYHEIYDYEPEETDLRNARISEEFKESDHEVLRELIVNWVRQTGLKVLACPEMTYGVPLAKEQLVDPLPEDVRRHVVWRDSFWMCDEAASVYARAVAVISLDCHSPIIALAAGTPAIHLRLPTDNPFKSRMFADIGLPEWIHEREEITGERLTELVFEIHNDQQAARKKAEQAMAFVHKRQAATMSAIRNVLDAT